MRSTEVPIKEDPKGKRAQIICEGWQQAETLLNGGQITKDRILELYNDTLKRAGISEIDSPSVGRWLTDWLSEKRKIAPSTRLAYEQVVREFLEFLGPGQHRKLENVSEKDIDGFASQLLSEGRSPSTVNKLVRKYLSGPFEKARKLGKIRYNPVMATEPEKAEIIAKETFTAKQVNALLRVAPFDWQGLILFSYTSGARLGDARSLKDSSLDIPNGIATFRQGKTGKKAVVGLHPDFLDWLAERPGSDDLQIYVFPSLALKPLGGEHGLSLEFQRLMEKAGIRAGLLREGNEGKGRAVRALTFHSFRHSAASAVFNQAALKDITRRVTNHAAGGEIDRYIHEDLEAIRAATALIPRLPKGDA